MVSPRGSFISSVRESVARVPRLIDVVVVMVAVVASIAVLGYQFGVVDHLEFVPLVRRAADARALAGDWYVDSATASAVRAGFASLMGGLSNGVGEWQAFLAVHLVTLTVIAAGLFRLAAGFGLRWSAAAAATLLAVLGGGGSLGLSGAFSSELVPTTLAWSLLVWALVTLRSGRFELTGALVGLTALIHPQIAVIGGAALVAWSLLGGAPRPTFRRALLSVLIAGLVGGASLVPTVLGAVSGSGVDAATVVNTIARLRLPWHMDPAAFGRNEWIGFAGALGAVVVTARDPRYASARRLAAIAVAASVVGVVGLALGSPVIVKMQLFRITPLIPIVVAVIVGDRVVSLIWPPMPPALPAGSVAEGAAATMPPYARLGRLLTAGALVLTIVGSGGTNQLLLPAIVPLLVVGELMSPGISTRRWITGVAVILAFAVIGADIAYAAHRGDLRILSAFAFVAIGIIAASRAKDAWSGSTAARLVRRAVFLASCVSVVLLLASATSGLVPPRILAPFLGTLSAQASPVEDLDRLAEWASRDLPDGALVLAPPGEPGWRFWSGLPEIVDFKAFPFRDADAAEWLSRLQNISGRTNLRLGESPSGPYEELNAAYQARSIHDLGAVARGYGAAYLVVPAETSGDCHPLRVQGSWALVEIGDACLGLAGHVPAGQPDGGGAHRLTPPSALEPRSAL